MSPRKPTEQEREHIVQVSDAVFEELLELPHPPHAMDAAALALLKVFVYSLAQLPPEKMVRELMRQLTDGVVKHWHTLDSEDIRKIAMHEAMARSPNSRLQSATR